MIHARFIGYTVFQKFQVYREKKISFTSNGKVNIAQEIQSLMVEASVYLLTGNAVCLEFNVGINGRTTSLHLCLD